jgi:hypothetical protein
MKLYSTSILAALLLPISGAPTHEVAANDEITLGAAATFLIETAPGETRWVTEDQKWELKRVNCCRRRLIPIPSLTRSSPTGRH